MKGLNNKVAVVTGSTDAIGRVIALRLAEGGAKVVVSGRTEAKGRAVTSEIKERGGHAIFVKADVREYEEMVHLVEHCVSALGQIDILISSTGGGRRTDATPRANGYFNEADVNDLAQLAADYVANRLNPVRAALDQMIPRRTGSIVMLASEGGRFPTPGQVGLALGAGGLIMATRTIAKELLRWHVRLNTISISLIDDTPIKNAHDAQVVAGDTARAKFFDKVIERAPLGLANPTDIAEVAAFLASDSARMLTGATVSPTGGLTFPP